MTFTETKDEKYVKKTAFSVLYNAYYTISPLHTTNKVGNGKRQLKNLTLIVINMLSYSIKNLSLVDIVIGIHSSLLKIECTNTMNHARSLIFSKTQYHTVKCLSFDMNCCITCEFHNVTCAIIKISTVIFALKKYIDSQQYVNPAVNDLLLKIRQIYHYMKEGLREYGCRQPLFTTGTCLKKDDVLISASIICDTWLQ